MSLEAFVGTGLARSHLQPRPHPGIVQSSLWGPWRPSLGHRGTSKVHTPTVRGISSLRGHCLRKELFIPHRPIILHK